ncbi:hypothetical protein V2I01_02345 [Micromonospora sp. BRA006-A]|nr:hypothetical protein [Micromonospora sp. BRA006-A]
MPTLTRNEVSRWERQLRLPGDFWSAWLATVLGVPGEVLAGAAARSRRLGVAPAVVDPAGSAPGWPCSRSRTAGRPTRAAARRPVRSPPRRQHGRPGREAGRTTADQPLSLGVPRGPDEPAGRGHPADRVTLATLRRWDDLLGGGDLAGHGARRLRHAVRGYRRAGPAGRRAMLPALAESAQLAGWLAADAGNPGGAWSRTGWRCGRRWPPGSRRWPGTCSRRPVTCWPTPATRPARWSWPGSGTPPPAPPPRPVCGRCCCTGWRSPPRSPDVPVPPGRRWPGRTGRARRSPAGSRPGSTGSTRPNWRR